MERARIILKSGKDKSLKRLHPWVFSGAIQSIQGEALEGDMVDVYDSGNEYIASGQYQNSTIAIRVLSFSKEEIDTSFFINRFKAALELRKTAGLAVNDQTNVFRFVNAEGDGLSGLVIDIYGSTAVVQMHTAGMYYRRDQITEGIQSVLGSRIKTIYDKSSGSLPFKAGIEAKDSYITGGAGDNIVKENGYLFKIDWEEGQKTGFFIDQRENRKLVKQYSKDRTVLNMFCYTGGFSVYAMAGDAASVESVDASAGAIDLTKVNIDLNFTDRSRHTAIHMDVFRYFNETVKKYDLIILDPPAFAKHQKVLDNALQGYKRLNRTAIAAIEPGGLIFTFSCSQVVSNENFRKSVFAAAAGTGRKVQILHQLSQSADHPVSIYHPEGEYLKGLVLKVE
jgi:23S rRNA (cytosine1962-C5)-methyltransferase